MLCKASRAETKRLVMLTVHQRGDLKKVQTDMLNPADQLLRCLPLGNG